MVLRPTAEARAARRSRAAGAGAPRGAHPARAAQAAAPPGPSHAGRHAAMPAAAERQPAPRAPSPSAARAPPPRRRAPRPGRAGQPLGAIQLLSGANAGKELELTKPLTTLGKPGVQVAVLTRRPQGYFITHVEGANRPTVNGQADRRRAARAQGPRRDRARRRQDGVLPQGLSSEDRARPRDHAVLRRPRRASVSHRGRPAALRHAARQHHLRLARAPDHGGAASTSASSSSTSTRRAWARSGAGRGAAA